MEEIIGEDVKDLEEYEEVSAGKKQGQQDAEQKKGRRPDLRIVQPETNQDGSKAYRSVGAMWKSVSKNGKEFYTLKIGELRLLVFPNEPRGGDYVKTQ
jgi:hypothetical protein